jgi:hypothetical protein
MGDILEAPGLIKYSSVKDPDGNIIFRGTFEESVGKIRKYIFKTLFSVLLMI